MVRKSTPAERRSSITCNTSALLAQADHQARLGEHRRIDLLDPVEQAQRMRNSARPAARSIKPRHGFEIVVEHIGPGRDHASIAPSLRRKSGVSTSIVVSGAAARSRYGAANWRRRRRQIVAIHRGDDDVREAELRHRLGDMLRLMRIERAGQPGRDVAEAAGAGADAPRIITVACLASSTRRYSGRPPPRRRC